MIWSSTMLFPTSEECFKAATNLNRWLSGVRNTKLGKVSPPDPRDITQQKALPDYATCINGIFENDDLGL